jgi:hypothetical protein
LYSLGFRQQRAARVQNVCGPVAAHVYMRDGTPAFVRVRMHVSAKQSMNYNEQ